MPRTPNESPKTWLYIFQKTELKWGAKKNLLGERNNKLNPILENKDFIPLLEGIEHYVQLNNPNNPDENILNADAYSYRKFMNTIDK